MAQGDVVINDDGTVGIDSNGDVLLFNASDDCPDCCGPSLVELNLEYNYTTRAISTVRPIDLEYNYTTRAISTVRPLDLEYNYEFVSVDVTEL